MNPESVPDRVRRCLAEVLALPVTQVVPEASLVTDLGMESIDFLDLLFRLEEEFGVPFPRNDLDLYTRLELGTPEYEHEGRLNEKALERIRQMVPGLKPDLLQPGLSKYQLVNLITVRTLVEVVTQKLAGMAP